MAAATPFEQLMLEYINQARMDPQGEYDRFILSSNPVQAIELDITQALNFFGVNLGVYQQQLQGLSAVAPLAWNSNLNDAATTHSQLMIAEDEQSHQLSGEASLSSRITASGYTNWNYIAENIYAYTESPAYGHAGFFIDWGWGPNGIQNPAGHRNNIMNANLEEVGIGVVEDNDGGTSVGPYVVTQDFGRRFGYEAQFVGVAYDDNDDNDFYSMGEGSGGISVSVVGDGSTSTQSAGGYSVEASAGLKTLIFSGGGLSSNVSALVQFGADNVKVDLVDGERIESSADATLGDGASDLRLLGQFDTDGIGNSLANTLWGNVGDNNLQGKAGADVIHGNDGNDTLLGGGGRDSINGDDGSDSVIGGSGSDTILVGAGNDDVQGGDGRDTVHGGQGDDVVLGNRGRDELVGESGNDTLKGGSGKDLLEGGSGADELRGGNGHDTLLGGSGDDTLIGNTGDDRFVFGAGFGDDVIDDFRAGADDIDELDFSALGIGFGNLNISQQGGSSLISTPGGDSVLLAGVLPGELDSGFDFVF